MIEVECRDGFGGTAEAEYDSLQSALDWSAANEELGLVTVIVVDGVRLTDEEMAAYPQDEPFEARAAYAKNLYARIQLRAATALAAARERPLFGL